MHNEWTVRALLNALVSRYGSQFEILGVHHESTVDDNLFTISCGRAPGVAEGEDQVVVLIEDTQLRIRVRVKFGHKIVYAAYPVGGDPNDPLGNEVPQRPSPTSPLAGGDRVKLAVTDYWGTMAFANKAGLYISNGPSTCDVSVPCFLTNRHVIGNARVGARINAMDDDFVTETDIGRLKCRIPVDVPPTTDVAIGQLTIPDVDWRMIRGIGRISGKVVPIGHTIYFKSGARTGVRRGEFLGTSLIPVDGHQYFAMRLTGGFGCNGDSGSLVVDGGRNLVGLYFAGEDLPCSQNPLGFAMPFTPPASRGPPGIVVDLKD